MTKPKNAGKKSGVTQEKIHNYIILANSIRLCYIVNNNSKSELLNSICIKMLYRVISNVHS